MHLTIGRLSGLAIPEVICRIDYDDDDEDEDEGEQVPQCFP